MAKKKVAQSKSIKKARSSMTDVAAGRIALKLLIMRMAEERESLRYITPEDARKKADLFGISTKEMVAFIEKLYGEILTKMFANLKKG